MSVWCASHSIFDNLFLSIRLAVLMRAERSEFWSALKSRAAQLLPLRLQIWGIVVVLLLLVALVASRLLGP